MNSRLRKVGIEALKGAGVGALLAIAVLLMAAFFSWMLYLMDEPGASLGTVVAIGILVPLTFLSQPWFGLLGGFDATDSLSPIIVGICVGTFVNAILVGTVIGGGSGLLQKSD